MAELVMLRFLSVSNPMTRGCRSRVNHLLAVVALISICAVPARAETPASESDAPRAGAATPPGGWPLPTPAAHLLLTVAGGVTLFDEPRNDLRAALGPDAGKAVGLDHPGFPSPCERATAATYCPGGSRGAGRD